MGVPDITRLPDYNPAGVHEAFGHGPIRRIRPDLTGADWKDFVKNHRLYHQMTGHGGTADIFDRILESGGKLVPTTDKVRRGILPSGMSPSQDLESGGADYVFTRIVTSRKNDHGLYWKTEHLKRLDAITYDGDRYGRTTGDTVLRNRRSTIQEFRDAAQSYNNETIFKGGLSLFDGLEKIVVSPNERQAVIDVFKRHGYDTFPDGRKIENIIKTR